MFKVELEKYGKVRVYFSHCNPEKGEPLPGTTCYMATDEKDGELITAAVTFLYYKDRFVKEKGRKYSLTKALKELGLSYSERAKVWEAYFARS